MGDTKYCYRCFEQMSDSDKECPSCGYNPKSPYSPSYIAPGTMLNERYLVGVLQSHNGEGATYVAFDTVISCKVLIREYMPDALCTRVKDTPVINVNHSNVAQYKSLMAEFTELNKKLARLRTLNHINPVLDLFSENNTTYAVFEYIEGENLIAYLKHNAGELSWKKVSKMFPPLFTSLGMLHNAGIVHRGISPQTIYVTNKGELRLTDFCIAAVRTTKTELKAEVFKGYAAPEQYSPSSRQGAWTDIYGICSVLYRILTGCMPTEAQLRNEESRLTPPSEVNPEVPENVSDAIMDGLRISGDERIQTITELVTRIFAEPSEDDKYKTVINIGSAAKPKNTNTEKRKYYEEEPEPAEEEIYEDEEYDDYDYEPVRVRKSPSRPAVRPAPRPIPRRPVYDDYEEGNDILSKLDAIKMPAVILFLAIIVVIIIVVFVKSAITTVKKNTDPGINVAEITTPVVTEEMIPTVTEENDDDTYPLVTRIPEITIKPGEVTTTAVTTDENGSSDKVEMQNLVGQQYDKVKLYTFANDLVFDVEYVFDLEHPRGEIIDQDIKSGVWVATGSTVKLKVSKGGSTTSVPDYTYDGNRHYSIDAYLAMLDEAGIKYRARPNTSGGYPSKGYAILTEPEPGTLVDSMSGDVVIVWFTAYEGESERLSEGVSYDAQAATGVDPSQAPAAVTTPSSDDDEDEEDEYEDDEDEDEDDD